MSEAIIPFYIPAPAVGDTGIIRINDPAVNTQDNELEVTVISGGPVFGWTGGVSPADAKAGTHPADNNNVEFDFAANIFHCSYFEVGSIGSMTLCSDNETIGYLRIKGNG
jgi:hypothetical protein